MIVNGRLIGISQFIFFYFFCICNASAQLDNNTILMENPLSIISRNDLVRDKNALKRFHPCAFVNFPESRYDSLIEVVAKTLPKKEVTETEKILIRRKVLDHITYEDPHFRFVPYAAVKEGNKLKSKKIVKVLPFDMLCVNDTLLVDKSYTHLIHKGDRLISINGENVMQYLEASYRDRYIYSMFLQGLYHLKFAHFYDIEFEREGKIRKLQVEGISATKIIYNRKPFQETIYESVGVGYFRIDNFDFNSYLVKRFKRFLKKLKANGMQILIIDLRRNPGGSGDKFDELFSMLSNKKVIPYQSDVKVKVSTENYLEYGFPEDAIGKLLVLPDKDWVKECPLDSEKYAGNFTCYILMSHDTRSMAASFANIADYNNIGILVGEPLAHNALKYGDVITGSRDNSRFIISTMVYEEYTNAKNGILKPEIPIPFIAREYMKGGDPVLEKCLEYIKNHLK